MGQKWTVSSGRWLVVSAKPRLDRARRSQAVSVERKNDFQVVLPIPNPQSLIPIDMHHFGRREAVEVGRRGVAVGADVLAVD